MKNRILAAILAMVILLTFVGCANNKTDAPAPETTDQTVMTETTGIAESDTEKEHTEENKNGTTEETLHAETTKDQELSESVTETTETKFSETKPQLTESTELQKAEETKHETNQTETAEPNKQTTEEPKETDPPETTVQETETAETTVQETETAETTAQETEFIPKSIYDAPFGIEQIRAELIAIGESIGMRHRTTYKDGTVITPENSSWELPILANASFSGDVLKRSLYEYVSSYDEYELYGGEPITDFTIYVKQTSDGCEFYFLH